MRAVYPWQGSRVIYLPSLTNQATMRITRTKQPPFDARNYQELNAWYSSALGRHLLGREQELIDSTLGRRFGYRLLQLGCNDLVMHEQSPMGHKFSFCPFSSMKHAHTAVAQGEAIPLPAESVDLVLLHHALDFSNHQHQLLREVARVLIAGGHIVIVGFNPISTWGVRNKCQWNRQGHTPFNARQLSSARVTDWLALLDFQVEKVQYAGYIMPINSEAAINYSGWLEPLAARLNWPTGAVYVISARKQVMPLTPVQLKWQRMPAMVLPGQKPASRTGSPLEPGARPGLLQKIHEVGDGTGSDAGIELASGVKHVA